MATVKGTLKPIKDKVIVHNMNFGEQKSSGGILVLGDDGKDRGIYPRWGQIFAVGPEHTEDFNVGDWILMEHGRWTRGITLELENNEETTIRMVDNKCILMWAKEKPGGAYIGDALTAPSINEAFRLENKQ
jgi:co-chaperonin GroES (HSP10)